MDKLYSAILAKRLQGAVPLHEHQFAFLKGRGTVDAVFSFASLLQWAKAQNERIYAFFLDVKKAYDTVWHDGLFYKLYHKGVRGKLWRVVRGMYTMGASHARLNGLISDPFRILQGVAQGCPMSCTLYNVHVDDLLAGVNRDCIREGIRTSATCTLAAKFCRRPRSTVQDA